MKYIPLLLATAIAAIGFPASTSVFAARTMQIRSFSITPHTVSRRGTLKFRAQVTGLRLDLAAMGKHATPGHGHFQYYLDRVPADAWTRADLHGGYIASVATTAFYLSLPASPVKITPGRHRFIVALARNNRVLYRTTTRSLTVVVR